MTSQVEQDPRGIGAEEAGTAEGPEGVRAARELAITRMGIRSGARALDLGCGSGNESVRLGDIVGKSGSVVGLEKSEKLVKEARGRLPEDVSNVTFEQGDMHDLPFEDDEFDASRAELVFLHLEDPDQALQEMVRLTRPGGRLVAVDPDVESFAIDANDPESSRKFAALFPGYVRHAQMGRSLRRRFIEAGLRDVVVTVVPMVFTNYSTALNPGSFDRLFDRMTESGQATTDQVMAIRSEMLEADARGTFAMYGSLYVASGVPA